MGDRANVLVKDDLLDRGVFLYTHWEGYKLPKVLKEALIRGRGRWNDTSYLTRIIFCEMVKGKELEETGFGISTSEYDYDNNNPLITIDVEKQTVERDGEISSFEEYTQI